MEKFKPGDIVVSKAFDRYEMVGRVLQIDEAGNAYVFCDTMLKKSSSLFDRDFPGYQNRGWVEMPENLVLFKDWLTLNKVRELHRELWGWLADNPTCGKSKWPGWEKYGKEVAANCFLCEYVRLNFRGKQKTTGLCPASFEKKVDQVCDNATCLGGLYRKYEIASTPEGIAKAAAAIRDIPICPFKVGDIITGTPESNSPYRWTNSEMTEGEVVEVKENGQIKVNILKHASGSFPAFHSYDVDSRYFKLVEPEPAKSAPKFKVGDWVEVTRSGYSFSRYDSFFSKNKLDKYADKFAGEATVDGEKYKIAGIGKHSSLKDMNVYVLEKDDKVYLMHYDANPSHPGAFGFKLTDSPAPAPKFKVGDFVAVPRRNQVGKVMEIDKFDYFDYIAVLYKKDGFCSDRFDKNFPEHKGHGHYENPHDVIPLKDWLTVDKVKELHREMWGWLADNSDKSKSQWPGWENIIDKAVISHCFLCEYANIDIVDDRNRSCLHCPAELKNRKGDCLDGLFATWASSKRGGKERSELARAIGNIPFKGDKSLKSGTVVQEKKVPIPRFNVGDRVRIKSAEEMKAIHAERRVAGGLAPQMLEYASSITGVVGIVSGYDSPAYKLDNDRYAWDERLLEPANTCPAERQGKTAGSNLQGYFDFQDNETKCSVNVAGKSYTGTAHCFPWDKWDTKTGKKYALLRALESLTEDLRQELYPVAKKN